MRDAPPDYRSYSISELQEALAHVDREHFPDRASEIEREIECRENDGSREVLEAALPHLFAYGGLDLISQGVILGSIEGSAYGYSVARITLGTSRYSVQSAGFIKRIFTLTQGTEVLAGAVKRWFFSERIAIQSATFSGDLIPDSHRIVLRSGESRVGTIGPSFADPLSVILETSRIHLPLHLRAFILWLYVLEYQHGSVDSTDD
jgi:hypothetical protein